MVATSSNKGQLWLFGGEFASPSQAQFYHYRDLWVYHMATKQWEKIQAPNGPSARSGHRMVYVKKNLIVFGGFHDNLRDYKYFNDVYSFNTEDYKWTKLSPSGTPPAPRSACCMVALNDGRVLIYGGYSKEKVKKDLDKGHVYTDAFILTPEKNDPTGSKWKWVHTKLGGVHFSPRCSMPITATPNNAAAYCYGGVFDVEDDEENLAGVFYNDFYCLDLEKFVWKSVTVSGKKNKEPKEEKKSSEDVEMQEIEKTVETTTICDDGVFKVTVGPSLTSTSAKNVDTSDSEAKIFRPSPRINSGLAVKRGMLYLYGGMFEDGDKQITFSDFYSVDLKKLEEWKVLIADDTSTQEWLGSDNESNDEDDDEEIEDEEESEESEESDREMQVDA
ncbi:hypothetical protein GEV33_001181 [Tenebrio molitor]|uniref:Kelch domain-containing protein 4 n=1 Tax=Tenebrio molitor TaxID=7067 RepID=A0A8J6HVQ5_TENMO|nr:hypothetical protein GEV33_001181 [Tenebrio molitor]